MQYPKLLIVANQCLSKQTSNGRTLRNFLTGWPKEHLAQFCTQLEKPDYDVCDNYYCVTDSEALNAFIGRKRKKLSSFTQEKSDSLPHSSTKKHKRNAITMMVRDLIWNSNRWKSKQFDNWVSNFNPQVVLLQAGDSRFMFNIARKLAIKYNASLIIYNSEGYYFKNFDYFRSKGLSHYLYPLFHKLFQREFTKTIKFAQKSIYICDSLKEDYDAEFHLPSETIYTATEVQSREQLSTSGSFIVSYLGNLGVGRHKGLIDIAEALQKISPSLFLDVYGKIPNDAVKKDFENTPGIHYKGFISYSEVVDVMHKSDLLVHCESFDDFYRIDLKYAFSTKIADSLASGTPFLLYAPKEFAISKYLNKNKAAFVVSEKEKLTSVINQMKDDFSFRTQYINSAISLVKRKHNLNQNALEFQKTIIESIEAL